MGVPPYTPFISKRGRITFIFPSNRVLFYISHNIIKFPLVANYTVIITTLPQLIVKRHQSIFLHPSYVTVGRDTL